MKQITTILLAIICQGVFAQLAQNPKIDLYIKQTPVSYTHLRAHETVLDLVCRLLLEKKQKLTYYNEYVINK